MWKIVFPTKLFEEMKDLLFKLAPSENGCFLLANCYTIKKNWNMMLVTKIIEPDMHSWDYAEADSLGPSSTFINRATVAADDSGSSLIFVHTHPGLFHTPLFSPIDEDSNRRLFANLSEIILNKPLGSIVISRKGIYGAVFDKKRIETISKYETSGNILSELPTVNDKQLDEEISPYFDRQVRLIGEKYQKKLQEMTISIIGAGGTGSAVAIQLARMGVGKLRLIDFDSIEESNVSRVYGSKPSDVGKAKIDVLKRHIRSFSATQVETLNVDITRIDIVSKLLDSDVLFGCTDNLSSRAILNDVAIQYYKPLIDVGARIHLNPDHSVEQMIAKVQVVTPDTGCLWCTGTLDGKIILQESFSDEEKKNSLKRDTMRELRSNLVLYLSLL